jgi:hypothetical protein
MSKEILLPRFFRRPIEVSTCGLPKGGGHKIGIAKPDGTNNALGVLVEEVPDLMLAMFLGSVGHLSKDVACLWWDCSCSFNDKGAERHSRFCARREPL